MRKYALLFLILPGLAGLFAQETDERYVPETDPLVLAKLEQWQDLKFGGRI